MKKILLCTVLMLLCISAFAEGFASKEDYLALVKKTPCPKTVYQLREAPDAADQAVVQIRGEVASVKDNTVCINDGTNFLWVVMPDGTDMNELEEEDLCILASYDKNALLSLSGFVCCEWTFRFPLESYEKSLTEKTQSQPAATGAYAPTGLSFAKAPVSQPTAEVGDLIKTVAKIIKSTNSSLSQNEVDAFTYSILKNCSKYEVHPLLVCAIITEESRFRPTATSRAGACGLGQLMPRTAKGMGINNPYDPIQNIYGTVRYIKGLQERLCGKSFRDLTWGDLSLILSGYNAGPTRVRKYGGVPPIKETQNYVNKVTKTYKKYLNLSL